MSIDFTESELREFSPHMADFYVHALLDGKAYLADAGITLNGRRFSHFMGQFGAETNGGAILRESLTYTSVARIKQVWPARARKASEAELKALLRNPVALGDWAYGGRLGNKKGTSDGFDFRGGGFLQSTGRGTVDAYCRLCDIPIRPDILDDPEATLRFACEEWTRAGCNELADANDLSGVSAAINTGSATSGITPNGMDARTAWFKKAQAIWWDAAEVKAIAPQPPVQADIAGVSLAKLNDLADQGSRVAAVLQKLKRWVWGGGIAAGSAAASIDPNHGTGAAIKALVSEHPFLVLAVVLGVIGATAWVGLKLLERYLLTAARDGRYSPRGGA